MFGTTKNRLAKLRYGPNDIRALQPGDHVICAQSGAIIPLDELRYWSVARQEPYAGPVEATKALLDDAKAHRTHEA